jgi:AcrR family transcriptional regulator
MNKRVERGLITRRRIIAVAKSLLAKNGYEGVSIEDILEHCKISRGAFYHHFETKEALFQAVLEMVEEEVAQVLAKASSGFEDPVEALKAGCDAWFALAREPAVRQIVLTDALTVVGWEKWREIDARHGFGRLKAALKLIAAQGRIPEESIEIFAHILLATVIELGFLIARAKDREATTKTARAAYGQLLDGLVGPKAAQKKRGPLPEKRRS